MDDNIKVLNFKGDRISLKVSKHMENGKLGIIAYSEYEPYGNITKCLPEFYIKYNEGFIDIMTKTSGLEQELIKEGIIKRVISKIKYNMEKYDFVEFDLKKLKEYDPEGVKKYQEEFEEEFEGDL